MTRLLPFLLLAACAGPGEPNSLALDTSLLTQRGGWSSGRLGGLDAHVYVPVADGRTGTGRGLLVAMHGCTMNYNDMRDNGAWVAMAEEWGVAVVLPDVPNGGQYARCWSYYGSNHSRATGTPRQLLTLVDDLLADPDNGIDPDQVYISGLSSGGGMAMVMGCLAPDVFAGVGIAAGPTVGTSASQISRVSTTESAAVGTCRRLAGSASGDFATQMTSVVSGRNDYTVAQAYGDLNVDVMGALYTEAGASLASEPVDVSSLPGQGQTGSAQEWFDVDGTGRLSRIQLDGMGHAWPAGTGAGFGNAFIDPNGLDYAAFLAEWFTVNNPRTGGVTPPVDDPPVDDPPVDDPPVDDPPVDDPPVDDPPVDDPPVDDPVNAAPDVRIVAVTADGSCVRVVGAVTDDADDVVVDVLIDTVQAVDIAADGTFTAQECGLPPGCYAAEAVATDALGLTDAAIAEPVGISGGAAVQSAEGTIFEHFTRFSSYPHGYGTADATYPTLFSTYGMSTRFTLYQDADGDWFLDPANAGAGEAIDCAG